MTEEAMFGAGCFWGVEELFRTTPGVTETAVGYAGGNKDNPTYQDVCYTDTGHAEVVHITFNPEEVSYEQLLAIFFKNHNPTTRDRQGPDYGSQYRSVIFYYNDAQKAAAEKTIAELEATNRYINPIVTQVVEAPTFWRAEEYHQKYLAKKGLRSCHL